MVVLKSMMVNGWSGWSTMRSARNLQSVSVSGSVNRTLVSEIPWARSSAKWVLSFTPSTSHHTRVSFRPGRPGT